MASLVISTKFSYDSLALWYVHSSLLMFKMCMYAHLCMQDYVFVL